MVCFKFNLLHKTKGSHGKKHVDRLMRMSNVVNEEYMEAFRTKSFIEMCSKIQSQWGGKTMDKLSSSPSLPRDLHFSRGLLDPSQSTLTEVLLKGPDDELRQFLACFFKISSDACKIFESILISIHQTRANCDAMGRVLEQLKRISDDDQRNKLYRNLASFASLKNPLAIISQVQFQDIHDNLYFSLQLFTSRGKKIRRRRKLIHYCKKIAGVSLVATCCALTMALLILAIHSAVGIVAVPGLAACSLGLFLKKLKRTKGMLVKTTFLERFQAQIDAAAKGIYLLMNDFDTMSRLMTRLHDEIEHSKFIADLCLRRRSDELLKEVVRAFQIKRNGVINQLEELEDHVYLCILNINRSRRLLTQEMVAC